jgi:hypothetical protein
METDEGEDWNDGNSRRPEEWKKDGGNNAEKRPIELQFPRLIR